MNSSKLSVAIIGAGQIAGGYDQHKLNESDDVFTHAGAYKLHGDFELITICDMNGEQAKHFQKHWQVGANAKEITEIFRQYHDVVSVCTPDESHFSIVKELLQSQCCKVIFVEKPVALSLTEIDQLIQLSSATGIQVVANFQRRNEECHQKIQAFLQNRRDTVLAINAYYIKGLDHIGTTMIDTLTYLLGYPRSLLSYNRVYNQQIGAFTYEFLMFYENFNITVKTVDSPDYTYNYHIFEIDILLNDRRITIQDNSRQAKVCRLADYAYSEVQVLDDRAPTIIDTAYSKSMLQAVCYVFDIAKGKIPHTVNTLQTSYNSKFLVDQVKESYKRGQIKIEIGVAEWKK